MKEAEKSFVINPLMPGGNRKVTHAGLFKYM